MLEICKMSYFLLSLIAAPASLFFFFSLPHFKVHKTKNALQDTTMHKDCCPEDAPMSEN